jgi:DGQHR domain-containing protein
MTDKLEILRFAALRIEQRADVPLYIFGVNGRLIHQFATVNFAERSVDGVLAGYQRTRVAAHIAQIRTYLAHDDALLPNAIVIAFNGGVTFAPAEGTTNSRWGTHGTLSVPLPGSREPKPGLIVDGQQRVSALAELPPERQFPVVIVSFSSSSLSLQREQFVLVNKTKPLPRDLLNELIPHVRADILPRTWQVRRIASGVVEVVRFDTGSPFYGRIRGLGVDGEGYNISQAAVLSVIETSIRQAGVLNEYMLSGSGMPDFGAMAHVISTFYHGVAAVWPYAWNENPWTSRLVHGVGITALGRLMDIIMREVDAGRPRAVSSVKHRLQRIEKRCFWTQGWWPRPLDCAWDQLQNTSQDKRRLADYLVNEYARAS